MLGGARPSTVGTLLSLSIPNPGWLCVLAALALSGLGVYAINLAETSPSSTATLSPIAWRQLVYAGVGVLGAVAIALPSYRWLGMLSSGVLVLCVGLLIFLLIPAVPRWIVEPHNGARGWINFGFADFQPAELTKIAYVLVIAQYLRYRKSHRRAWGLLVPGLITMVPVSLITLQPDLGTACLFVPSLFAMLVAAGARLRHLTLIVALAALAAPLSYPLLKPHQQSRIIGLIKQFQGDTSADKDINYQSMTARTLIGAGGAAGLEEGLSRSLIRYNELPERHNDMVFAVIVNRFGFLGALAVIALYLTWLLGALLAAVVSREPFGRLVIVGLAGFIAAQVFLNIGMNIGLAPIVGITLPFLSYGGSSMLTVWMMTGLVMGIAVRRQRSAVRNALEFDDD
jgi:rod shape determining protein RodA